MKILIIEDDKSVRELIKLSLEKWNYEVVLIEDFYNITKQVVEENPQLILLDINLPSLDGFTWCAKIREISQVPIIFISSRDSTMDQIMAMNMGGDDFVQKPFSEEILVAKINALLRRTYSYSEKINTMIECSGIVLNLQSGVIRYEGQEIELTKNEQKILSILMQNKGEIISRETIIESLWDDANFINDNTLTVNITRIRKKLSELGKDEMIKTIKNGGYKIT